MAAASRSEARRRAILARGNDRLAKLTASARGEGAAPAIVHDDQPVLVSGTSTGLEAFIGEESDMPSRRSPTTNTFSSSPQPSVDPSTWSEEQQKQFLEALMGTSRTSFRSQAPLSTSPLDDKLQPTNDDPLASLMSITQADVIPSKVEPPTLLRKLMPLVHLITIWILLAYFALIHEPKTFETSSHGVVQSSSWQRWADLAQASSNMSAFLGVRAVPFFWAFISLQIGLDSVHILYGYDTNKPSGLFGLLIPHLPPPVSSIAINGLKYLRMGGIFLDDVAGVIVGLGFIVWISGWFINTD